jgi:hypothetical protein
LLELPILNYCKDSTGKKISWLRILLGTSIRINSGLRHGILIQVKSKTPLGTAYLAAFSFILELTKKKATRSDCPDNI